MTRSGAGGTIRENLTRYTTAYRKTVVTAAEIAARSGSSFAHPLHLLLALGSLEAGTASLALRKFGAVSARLRGAVLDAEASPPAPQPGRVPSTVPLLPTFSMAPHYADARSDARVRTGDLLLALIDGEGAAVRGVLGIGLLGRRRLRQATWDVLVASRGTEDESGFVNHR